jgi:hypothetical protein
MAHILSRFCNPFFILASWLAVILLLGAQDTRLPPGSGIPSDERFSLVVPNPANPGGAPIRLAADKLAEFRATHPGVPLAIPANASGAIRSGNQYVVYAAREEGGGTVVEVATHPDHPESSRLGHMYTRRSLYRVDANGINAVARKLDIPLPHWAPLVLITFFLWVLPGWWLVRTIAIRRLREGPPFATQWLVQWGGFMRYASIPASWEPVVAALRGAGARTSIPTEQEKHLARLGSRAEISVRYQSSGGFIAFIDAGRSQWSPALLNLVGPAALIVAIDDVLSARIDPFLHTFHPGILAALVAAGVGAILAAWHALNHPDLGAPANHLACILDDELRKQECARLVVERWDDLRAKN